jgi:hypothetical protein
MMPAMTPVRDLETKASTLVQEARALKITNQQGYERAVEHLLGVVDLRHEIEQHYAPLKRKSHEAWQTILSAEKQLLAPVAAAEQAYKTAIVAWETEQRRIEAEAQATAAAEARAKAEEARERQIELAEMEGATGEEIASMINEPLPVIPSEVQPAFQQAKGVSTAVNWKGEVVSLEMLVRSIAAGQASISLVMPNQTSINALAKVTRNTLAIPGVRFFSEPVVRAGRR